MLDNLEHDMSFLSGDAPSMGQQQQSLTEKKPAQPGSVDVDRESKQFAAQTVWQRRFPDHAHSGNTSTMQ